MKKLSAITILLLMMITPALSQYSISGNLTGGQSGLYLKIAIAFDIAAGTFQPALSTLGSYTISDLNPGDYVVAGFQDLNWNMFPDAGEPFGYYDGEEVAPVTVPPNQSGINLVLVIQPNERFSGTITYSGTLRGATILRAFNNPMFSGNPIKIDIVRDTTGAGTGPYEFHISPGTYYLQAHMDRNGDVAPSVGEPYGYYGAPGNPQPIIVTSTSFPTGVNVQMTEIPLLPVEVTIDRYFSTGIELRWNPIPFVQIYNIYRGSEPNILPGGTPYASTQDTTWCDTQAISNANQFFYIVTATDETR